MKKASIQLSTNFIVIMVLTLIVLGMGFTIFGQIFDGAKKIVDAEIDERCKQYLDTILRNTDIAFCETTITTEQGDEAIAWLGVVNTYDNDACYRINVERVESESGEGTLQVRTLDSLIKTQQSDYLLVGVDSSNAITDTYAVTLQVLALDKTSCETGQNEGPVEEGAPVVTRKLFVEVK